MIQTQKRPDAASETVKAQRRDKPVVGSRKKPGPDLNESAKGARKAGKGEERLLETWKVECSCCGQKFTVPFDPKDTDRPFYGPCCSERHERGSQTI